MSDEQSHSQSFDGTQQQSAPAEQYPTPADVELPQQTFPDQMEAPPKDFPGHERFRSLLKAAGAELIGSALFVFIACGAGMTTVLYQTTGPQMMGIAFTFGFMIFTLAYMIGHISGAHLNFAVTFTFCLLGKISITKCVLYFLAQFCGGLIGIGFLMIITPPSWTISCFAANFIRSDLTVGHAFCAEFIGTFFLMFVIMAACDTNKSNQTLVPLAIGVAVFCVHMVLLPITGCSINPTRTFASSVAASSNIAPAVCSTNAWANHWLYWFAPLLGASTAGVIYEYCFHEGGYKVDMLIDQYLLHR